MAYSCTDFTDDVLNLLRIQVPEESQDDPQAQFALVKAQVEELYCLLGSARGAIESPEEYSEDAVIELIATITTVLGEAEAHG